MAELGWYSRLALWACVIVLVVQSVTGHSTGVVTAIAVVLLTLALPIFLYTLFRDSGTTASTGGDSRVGDAGETGVSAEPVRDMENVPGA